MTRIEIVELQKVEFNELLIGHKVTVEHEGQKKEKICVFKTLHGENAMNELLVAENLKNDTDWIETLPLVAGSKTEWMHETKVYKSFEEFDNDGWTACDTRRFVWDCEEEMCEE